ncbi:MAG: ABC transporter permease [Chryseolinea sp.]
MKRNKIGPPKWAEHFLKWYCKPEVLEDLQGDLNEYFERNIKYRGPRRARLIYVVDVFKFLRTYTIRRPKFIDLLIHWIMIGSYFKTASRSIVRNKLFSAINIIGLSIGMSVGLLVIAFIYDLTSYDDFHEKKDKIYRITTTDTRTNQFAMKLASTSVKAGKQIKETIPGIEDLTILRNGFGGDAATDERVVPMSGLWADESFLKIFSFELLQGDPSTALKEPYSIVLTEKAAIKIFGSTSALGKSLKFDTANYLVTGVLKDVPKLSHIRFESLGSFSTIEMQKPNMDGDFLAWENIYMSYVYLTIPEQNTQASLQANLNLLSARQNANITNRKIELVLQPLKEISIGMHLQNEIGPTMNSIALWVLSSLAFIIIVSACFNYTNLSIARSMRRSREVGIRKVIGALKTHVVSQFVVESIIIALLALVFSFVFFLVLRTEFLSLDPYIGNLASLELTVKLIVGFVAFATFVGLLAGLLPAFFFSRINVLQVLKSSSSIKLFRHVNLRKTLMTIQYVFSLFFISSTIVGYGQYRSFLVFDLGFKTENILNIKLQGNKGERLIKELSELPGTDDISQSVLITSLGSNYGAQLKYKNDSAGVMQNIVDVRYLPLHQHKLLAGMNFSQKPHGSRESEVIVNEQMLKRFNFGVKDPNAAIGETIVMDGKTLMIIGVMCDFHYETLEDEIVPTVFRNFADGGYQYLNVKISSTDLPATLASIESAWKKIDKVHPMEAKFYDDQIEEAYRAFSMMIKVIGFIATLTVCIASLGLFGMIVFTTETRLREISIRKVLGANDGSLVFLQARGFLFLLALSMLIASPLTYLFFDKVVLLNFAYHRSINLIELLAGSIVITVFALLMIGSQTIKAARSNPSQVLKTE